MSVESKYTERRSKFHALLFEASSVDEVKECALQRKRKLRKANHHCWACRIKEGGRVIEEARDDGEVGRPGIVLLERMRLHDLYGGLIVSRVFGGAKLGVGGVSRAFRAAADQVIDEKSSGRSK